LDLRGEDREGEGGHAWRPEARMVAALLSSGSLMSLYSPGLTRNLNRWPLDFLISKMADEMSMILIL
jgi:hypothetical protein